MRLAQKPGVVLDKNFLQGASRSRVQALAQSHDLVMAAALFHELLTTDPDARRKCFGKLPATENPVLLVDHIGRLIAHEIETGQPAGKPSSHQLPLRFRFNSDLTKADYRLPEPAEEAVREQRAEVAEDIERLLDLSETIPSLFPQLLTGTSQQQLATTREAEACAADLRSVLGFYQQLEPDDMAPRGPTIQGDLKCWAHLRWLQVLMLFALDVHIRYRGRVRQQLTPKVLERLEHDVHDAQILALGVLEGAIATQEKKLRRWWELLTPGCPAFDACAKGE